MKRKTSELTGAELDYAVALALVPFGTYEKIELRDYGNGHLHCWAKGADPEWIPWEPSVDRNQGGPIIEKYFIETSPAQPRFSSKRREFILSPPDIWRAVINWELDEKTPSTLTLFGIFKEYGPTPLVAAMRCFVAYKLGEEVEIP